LEYSVEKTQAGLDCEKNSLSANPEKKKFSVELKLGSGTINNDVDASQSD
jgi:hypothetical protein